MKTQAQRHSFAPRQLLLSAAILTASASGLFAGPTVELTQTSGRYQLIRDGQPYQIHGVGGSDELGLLAKSGGNSIRTWSTDGLGELLDAAHSNGLSVCVGMWLGHERHGFDYSNEAAVMAQLEQCLEAVRTYKDHPAVLLWGIGNEMEGESRNPAIWYAIDHIAREIKTIDLNHPTMTVIAELGEDAYKAKAIHRFCPNIDIVGINSYGGVDSAADRYVNSGATKPFVITEHGPLGPWEVGKTRWGAPIEATSTEKAQRYAAGYTAATGHSSGLCLGTYAFLWGHKQETTATWFGMLLPDGSPLAAVDEITQVWTGKAPANRCPSISAITLDRADQLKPGQSIKVKLAASDPDGDKISTRWVLRQDSVVIGVGGDHQAEEATFASAVVPSEGGATITVPDGGGGYRVFAYVTDNSGRTAVANAPFFVDAPIKAIDATTPKLPFVLYDDKPADAYAPSGYMGNTNAIAMKFDSTEQPHEGERCIKVDYSAAGEWGGVLWQSPPSDWDGTQPGGFNLSKAKALEFSVRGATNGQVVSFMLGVIEGNTPYRDSAKAELKDVRLTTEWNRLRIPLAGLDLSRIKTGFGWSLAGQGQPVTFYLDDIRYVSE